MNQAVQIAGGDDPQRVIGRITEVVFRERGLAVRLLDTGADT
jgi:hypothetical protein